MAIGIDRFGNFSHVPTMLDIERYNRALTDKNWRYDVSPPIGRTREHQRNCYFQAQREERMDLASKHAQLPDFTKLI